MGLTIHYTLKLETNSPELAREKIQALHRIALDLPFAEVGELLEFEGEECCFNLEDDDDPHRWLKLDASRLVEHGKSHIRVDSMQAIAFTTWPGEGCESASFGLAVFPDTIDLSTKSDRITHSTVIPTHLPPWSWSSFCKTQYTSNPEYGGIEHFLQCHGLVIKLLDTARELGILESVHDEGGYWENRDIQKLTESVGHYNALVAGVVGGLGTLLNNAGIVAGTYAPITEFPNYEYLEAEGQQQLKQEEDRE